MTTRKRFAVIGNPVKHSLSPYIHQSFAETSNIALIYERLTCEQEAFENEVRAFFAEGGQGLNVTVPFKGQAAKLSGSKLASVNTLWMEDGQIKGTSTDAEGFFRSLALRKLSLEGKAILVLGAGGVVEALMPELLKKPLAKLCVANRTIEKALKWQSEKVRVTSLTDLPEIKFDVLINALSTGWGSAYPDLDVQLADEAWAIDVNYAEGAESFNEFFIKLGGSPEKFIDGWGMLVEQAASSFEIWHGIRPDTEKLIREGVPDSL